MNEQQWREATLLCISKIDQLHTVTSPDPARAAFVAQVRVYFNNWGNREPITRLMGLIVQSFSVAYMQQHGQPETLRAIAEALEKATDDPL